jgi:phospholipid N-methyltransferase
MYLNMYHIDRVDYIVSGLPFVSLPTHVSNRILEKTRSVLKQDGLFLTFQYTLLKKKYIGRYFNKIELERVLFNMPPAYVFKCYNQK